MKNKRKSESGFTLIEVMIVVAIIGILAAIAYPSYQESVRKSNRADAKATLNDYAQRLQRCFTAYSAYNSGNCTLAGQIDGATLESPEGFYDVGATTLTATTYTLQATPKGSQATDSCGNLTLDHTGTRNATGSGDCW